MKIYDTLLIGSCYSAVGYALANKNTLIVEENEMADTRFYMPLKNYATSQYQPNTEYGKKLLDCFNSLGLIQNNLINANGLECAFCDFLSQVNLDMIFKSRVIKTDKENDHFCSQIITNSGIITVKSKQIIDTRVTNAKKCCLTVLLKGNLTKTDHQTLEEVFINSHIENTLYTDVYALFLEQPCNIEYNAILTDFFQKWKKVGINAKVLYLAPIVACVCENQEGFPKDEYFDNPVKALESGYFFYKKEANI